MDRGQTDDITLLSRWRHHRDAEAFKAIVTHYLPSVYGTSRRILGNVDDAEDVAQECFLQLAGGDIAIRRSLAGWLHRSATSKSLNALKKMARSKRREQAYAEASAKGGHREWEAIEPLVDEAIESLPEKQREFVVRHFLEQESFASLALDAGVSQRTVMRRVQQAILFIRKRLSRQGIPIAGAVVTAFLYSGLRAEAVPAHLVATLGKVAVAGASLGNQVGTAGVSTIVPLLGGTLIVKKIIAVALAVCGVLVFWWMAKNLQSDVPAVSRANTAKVPDLRPSTKAGPAAQESIRHEPETHLNDVDGNRKLISGRVYDAETGASIVGARLSLESGFVDTDSKGAFDLWVTSIAPQIQVLSVDADGYVGQRLDVSTINARVDFNLDPATQIVVRVVDEAQEVVAEARVYEPQQTDGFEGWTNGSGDAVVSPVSRLNPPRLRAAKEGYRSAWSDDPLPDDQGILRATIVLRPGEYTQRMILGSVEDPSKNPLSEMRVRCSVLGTSIPDATSDQDGKFTIAFESENESCILLVTGEGRAPSFHRIETVGSVSNPTKVKLAVEDAHWLEGFVLRADGSGVGGAVVSATPTEVELRRRFPEIVFQSGTDRIGYFLLEGLTGPHVHLVIKPPEGQGLAKLRQDHVAVDEQVRLTLKSPSPRAVRGRVLGADTGHPLMAFRVKFTGGPLDGRAFNAEDGRFVLRGITQEKVDLAVSAGGYITAHVKDAPAVAEDETQKEVLVHLSLGHIIEGVVIDAATSLPIPGAVVYSGDLRGTEVSWETGAGIEGRQKLFPDAVGKFLLREEAARSILVQARGYRPAILPPESRKENTDASSGLLVIALERGETITGTCYVDDAPYADAHVGLIRLAKAQVAGGPTLRERCGDTKTDSDGRFLFEGLHPGPHLLEYIVFKRSSSTYGQAAKLRIDVRPGEQIEYDIGKRLGPLTLSGRVLTSGKPAHRVELRLQPTFDWEYAEFSAVVDGSRGGRFRILGLRTGQYQVAIRGIDGPGDERSAKLPEIELIGDTEVDFEAPLEE